MLADKSLWRSGRSVIRLLFCLATEFYLASEFCLATEHVQENLKKLRQPPIRVVSECLQGHPRYTRIL